MNVLFVDDEDLSLTSSVMEAKKIKYIKNIFKASTTIDAIKVFKNNKIDVVVLDIEIDELSGIDLATVFKEINSDISIIFLTAYANYAINAFKLKVDGYLMKPLNVDDLHRELELVYYKKGKNSKQVFIKTFGNFEVFVDKKILYFSSAKAKELLAYLVCKRGSSVTSNECLDTIWDAYNNFYGNDFFRKAVFELNHILKKEGIDYIFINNRNSKSVSVDSFDCDFYKFLESDIDAINAYFGDFLSNYEWARDIELNLENQKNLFMLQDIKGNNI